MPNHSLHHGRFVLCYALRYALSLAPTTGHVPLGMSAKRHASHPCHPSSISCSAPCSSSAALTCSCCAGGRVWLTIGIPTIPRKGVDYLTTVLESLVGELPGDPSDPLYGNIRVVVMNNKPGKHEVWPTLEAEGGRQTQLLLERGQLQRG